MKKPIMKCTNCKIVKERMSAHCKSYGGVAPLTPPMLGKIFEGLDDCDMDNCYLSDEDTSSTRSITDE